jgi:hypothetical protein
MIITAKVITAKVLAAAVVTGAGLLAVPIGGGASPSASQAAQPCPSVGLPALLAPMAH